MSNKLENLDLKEIETTIEFCKNRFGTSDYINFCELFTACEDCPIGKNIEMKADCEEIYLYTLYKDLITDELIKEVKKKEWKYCSLDCHSCKLKKIYTDKNDCNIFFELILDYFVDESEEGDENENISKEYIMAKIRTLETKLDLILKTLLEKEGE